MKLSDIKGERTLEVVADLIEPVTTIAQNQNARELFTRKTVPAGMTANEFFMQRVRACLPGLLKDCKDEVVQVLATIKGQTPEEYAENLNLMVLMSDVIELLGDEEFLSFFTSANNETEQESQESQSESTEDAGDAAAS